MMSRAKPLLGTCVTIQVQTTPDDSAAASAIDGAFETIAHIDRVMSAHRPDSDLGRMSRAAPELVLQLDAHTVTVLKASHYWWQVSGGAFNPVMAARTLARQGHRPGLNPSALLDCEFSLLTFLSDTQVKMPGPVCIDLGGIAKGYAVDQAIQVLSKHGIRDAMVNAGGDIRVLGTKGFRVDICHAQEQLRDRPFKRLKRLQSAALATSVADTHQTAFVRTLKARREAWRNSTVLAPDCMTADALTKWALQSSRLCPQLKAAMRLHSASMWRS